MLEDPGGREPAPGALRAVQAFVNTVDIEHGHEVLTTPAVLGALLSEHGLVGSSEPLEEADLRRALELREALRALLLANNGVPIDAEARETLNRVARDAKLAIRFQSTGRVELLSEAAGVDAAFGRLLGIVFTAITDGSWPRLKACRRDVCHWVFYDQSRNRSSTWCAMSVCGNRTKTRAYRRRARERL